MADEPEASAPLTKEEARAALSAMLPVELVAKLYARHPNLNETKLVDLVAKNGTLVLEVAYALWGGEE